MARSIFSFFCVGFLVLGSAFAEQTRAENAQQAARYYKQGLANMKAGKIEVARTHLQNALKLNPQHTQARVALLNLSRNAKTYTAKARATALRKLMITDINLADARIDEAVNFLRAKIKEVNPEFPTNFVIEGGAELYGQREITLKLRRIPASALADMIASHFGAQLQHTEHVSTFRKLKKVGE